MYTFSSLGFDKVMTIDVKQYYPSCSTTSGQLGLAAASGAVTSVFGLDRVFGGVGAPPAIHWALAGVGADYYCKGVITPDQQTAMNAAAGYGGGFVAAVLFGR
jgi:hypothetical protein